MEKTEGTQRPAIIFSAYSFHAFPSGGFYYCWELGKEYDVTLLVEENNIDHPAVCALFKNDKISRIVPMPTSGNKDNIRLHWWAAKKIPALIEEIKPAAIFQSNFTYFHNKYIFEAAKKISPPCQRIIYLGVQILAEVDFEESCRELLQIRRLSWRERLRPLPPPLSSLLFEIWGRWRGFRDFTLMPLLLTGHRLRPDFDPWFCRRIEKHDASLFESVYCYAPSDKRAYEMELANVDKVQLVAHPMSRTDEATKALFPMACRDGSIAVLPSRCSPYDGREEGTEVDRLTALWTRCLNAIQSKLGGGTIHWKLHPEHFGEPIMEGLTRRLQQNLPDFKAFPTDTSAQQLILQSKAVVGDVSGILQWAQRLADRPVVSLNVFGIKGGDDMKNSPGITVINDPAELETDAPLVPSPQAECLSPSVTTMLRKALCNHPGS